MRALRPISWGASGLIVGSLLAYGLNFLLFDPPMSETESVLAAQFSAVILVMSTLGFVIYGWKRQMRAT
jgi:hypothetical protein